MKVSDSETWIDSLKGIAIIGVILVHSYCGRLPLFLGEVSGNGKYGVQLFFLISAYLTFVSLKKHFGKIPYNFKTIVSWWLKKFSKLIPLYYFSLLINIYVSIKTDWLGTAWRINIPNIIFHFLFLHGLVPKYNNSIIGVEWYIGVLAIFYMIAPLLFKHINSIEKSIISFLVSIAGSNIIIQCVKLFLPSETESNYYLYTYINESSVIAQLPVIMFGIFLYFIINKCLTLEKINNKKLLSYCFLIFSLLMILGEFYEKNTLFAISIYTRYAIWFGGISISQFLYPCKLIDNLFFQKIGQNSYPIYLFHFLIINIVKQFLHIENYNIYLICTFFISLCLSYLLSKIVIKYIDKPFKNFINKLKINSIYK